MLVCVCIFLVHRTHQCICIFVYEVGSSPSRFVLRERRCRRKNDIRLDFGVDADAAVFAIAESWRYLNEADDAIDDDENDDATDSAQSSSFGPSNVVDDFDLDTLFRKAVTARPNISLCSPSSLLLLFLITNFDSEFRKSFNNFDVRIKTVFTFHIEIAPRGQ